MKRKNIFVTTDMLREDGLVSKPYTMISEFIDNSISSWIGKGGTETLNQLIIEIIFDYSNKDNFKISIVDNAYGMNSENLEKSLEFANKDKKFKTSNLNRYGVGMKVASFWTGERLDIYSITKSGEKNHVFIDLEELDIENSKIVEYYVESGNFDIKFIREKYKDIIIEHGTKIEISKGNSNRYDLLKPQNMQNFSYVISWKFNKFIEMGAKISVGIINEKGEAKYGTLRPFKPESENLAEWSDEVILNSKKIDHDKKQEVLIKFKENFIKGLENYEIKDEILFDIKQKVENREKFEWVENIYLGDLGGKDINLKIKIGILKNVKDLKSNKIPNFKYVSYTGFVVYEANRAIMCGPNDFDDSHGSKNYIAGLKTAYGGEGIEYRIFGEFEIDDLLENDIVSLSDQKFGFEWKNKKMEEIFLGFINTWKNNHNPVLRTLTNMQQNFSEPEKWTVSKKTRAALKNTYVNSINFYDDEDIVNLAKKEGVDFFYLYKNPKLNNSGKIKITHIESNYVAENFYKLHKLENNNYEIIINILHPIWKPLVSGTNISKPNFISSVHRLSFLLACLDEIKDGSADLINDIANSSFSQFNE